MSHLVTTGPASLMCPRSAQCPRLSRPHRPREGMAGWHAGAVWALEMEAGGQVPVLSLKQMALVKCHITIIQWRPQR